jgi:GNAT superfamily N-acetyltransferase
MKQITTREAAAEDARDITQLNKLFNKVDLPPEHYASRLSDPARVETFILAEMGGQVVGFAGLRISPTILYTEPHAEITELFVMEASRRQGVGRALMAHTEKIAHAQGANEIIVATDFYNHDAQEFYRALGYGHHDITLSKAL